MGIRNRVKGIVKRLVDQQETQEAFDALFYFLNRFCKVSDLPPAEGDLRLLQRGDTALLRVFDRLCEKHGLMIPEEIDSGEEKPLTVWTVAHAPKIRFVLGPMLALAKRFAEFKNHWWCLRG